MGPWFGWLGGWAIGMTGVLVVGSLANVGVTFALLAFGPDDLVENAWVVNGLTVALILADDRDLRDRHRAVGALPGRADHRPGRWRCSPSPASRSYAGLRRDEHRSDATRRRSCRWLNPFGAGGAALTGGLLLGVFAYWGWESAVNLNEETEGAASTPGRAAIVVHRRAAGHLRRRGHRGRRLRRHRLPRRERRARKRRSSASSPTR